MTNQQKIKSHLESATNFAVLLVSVVVLLTCARIYLTPDSTPQLQKGLQKGNILPSLPVYSYGDSSRTLIIALNTDCGYCSQSIPFYKKLLSSNSKTTRIVAVFINPADKVKQYLRQQQFDINTFPPGTNFNEINVTATPTLILVDDKGAILNFWVGKLSEDDEGQVIRLIGNTEL